MAITTRRQTLAAAKKRLKLPLPGGLARGVRPISHNKRGKKSYKAGNILKEISIGKTSWVGAKVKMPYRQYRAVTSGPTGQIAYGPKGPGRRVRTSTTRLVSRRCESKKECKDWAGKYGGKMTYIKYRKKKFYKNNAALDTRKTYNKAEPNGRGFIQSYRQARANYAQNGQNVRNALARQRQMRAARRSAAKNAVATRQSMRIRGSSPTKKRKRTNVDPSAIVYGKRKRMQTVR